METGRGCPYTCAFCYWGGAIGTRIRDFSRQRLRSELELLGRLKAETVVLCDANFGMRRKDQEFVQDLLEVRARHGYPRYLETSWAKNKSAIFFDIVALMRREGLGSSFTLALQTLNDEALAHMSRRNMRLNEWRDLARWLREQDIDAYAELIWGAPGETAESFLQGYDQLAQYTSRIAVYPLLVLPNTAYDRRRTELGLVTTRGHADDFEYVLAHRGMTILENSGVQRFLFWARLMAEHMFFRHIWAPLRVLEDLSQSAVISRFVDFVETVKDPLAEELRSYCRGYGDSGLISTAIRRLYETPDGRQLFDRWWNQDIIPSCAAENRLVLSDVYRYDVATRPVYDPPGGPPPLPASRIGGEILYVSGDLHFQYAIGPYLRSLGPESRIPRPQRESYAASFAYKRGFYQHVENHEMACHYVGRRLDEILTADNPPPVLERRIAAPSDDWTIR
jgi:radical SAM C-methyltransferase